MHGFSLLVGKLTALSIANLTITKSHCATLKQLTKSPVLCQAELILRTVDYTSELSRAGLRREGFATAKCRSQTSWHSARREGEAGVMNVA